MGETSPLPWFVHDFADPRVSERPGPEDVTISCDHPATITVASMGRAMTATLDEARANAALICRAVNSHTEMVEALRAIDRAMTETWGALDGTLSVTQAGHTISGPWLQVRSALAKATGGEG